MVCPSVVFPTLGGAPITTIPGLGRPPPSFPSRLAKPVGILSIGRLMASSTAGRRSANVSPRSGARPGMLSSFAISRAILLIWPDWP